MNVLNRRRGLSPVAYFLPVVLVTAGILAWSGCGKKSAQATSPPTETNAAAQPMSANPRPVVAAPSVQPVTVVESADTPAVLSQLTQVLRRYCMANRRVPQSLSELTAAGYLKALPPPPPGRRFAIDMKNIQVVLKND